MFCGSFETQNSMVTFIFKFRPRKGQFWVKLGQIRSDFKSQIFLRKTCLSCPAWSLDSKNAILCTTIRNAKECVSKMWRHHLYLPFLAIAQQQVKVLLWIFLCVLFVCFSITYIQVLWILTWKFWILFATICEIIKFLSLGIQIGKYQKSVIAIL